MKKVEDGFTLIELLIVVVILGILAALVSGNFITSLKKGRDARRKTDLEQVQRALEMYYEDNKVYPKAGVAVGEIDLTTGGKLCYPSVSGCDTKIYMQRLPQDPSSNCQYYYVRETAPYGEGYRLYATIENSQDQGPGVDQGGYAGTNCGTNCKCKFLVGSANYP